MIVSLVNDAWRVVRQADHARLAGEMVGLLRLPALVDHPRRDDVLRAVREHDSGWWEEDAAPRLDPSTGRPLDFRSLDRGVRREAWRRGVERLAPERPYAAALVAGHFLRVGAGEDDDGAAPFREALTARRDELLEIAGETLEAARADDRWLALGDGLALAAASGDPVFVARPFDLGPSGNLRASVEVAEGAVELRLDPFPLAGATRFELPERRLPSGIFGSDVELGLALAGGPTERRAVRLLPT